MGENGMKWNFTLLTFQSRIHISARGLKAGLQVGQGPRGGRVAALQVGQGPGGAGLRAELGAKGADSLSALREKSRFSMKA